MCPAFPWSEEGGGVAIAVFDRENRWKWGRAWSFVEDGRVSNLPPADHAQDSALSKFLSMAVENLARKISLMGSAYQGGAGLGPSPSIPSSGVTGAHPRTPKVAQDRDCRQGGSHSP
jgi:hypothetical protein